MPHRREPMNPVDTAWLHMERVTNPMMITGIMLFDEPLEFEGVCRLLEQRLARFDRFRQLVVETPGRLGTPQWQFDPHFDIRNHVHHVALPAPGDQAALERLVSDLAGTPLDFNRPLWHYHLVEGVGGGSALIGRMHHCIADGIALMGVLLSLTDASPDVAWTDDRHKAEHPHQMSGFLSGLMRRAGDTVRAGLQFTDALVQGGRETLENPAQVLDAALLGVAGVARLARVTLYPSDPPSVFRGELGLRKRAVWTPPLELDAIKQVGRAFQATVNDVLVACLTGAMRAYSIERGVTPEEDVRAFVPVNLRPIEKALDLGNVFGLVQLSLPLRLDDPLERLAATKARMDDIKTSPEPVLTWGILAALGSTPQQAEELGIRFFTAKATLVLTNVPGPRQTRYVLGRPLRMTMGWAPASGDLGMSATIISYCGQVWLGLLVDDGVISDPHALTTAYLDQFETLSRLAAQQSAA